MNQAVAARMRFIDFLLDNYGTLNRKAIEDYFGLSTPQASQDIARYVELAPDNLVYDRSTKVYVRASSFIRKFP